MSVLLMLLAVISLLVMVPLVGSAFTGELDFSTARRSYMVASLVGGLICGLIFWLDGSITVMTWMFYGFTSAFVLWVAPMIAQDYTKLSESDSDNHPANQ